MPIDVRGEQDGGAQGQGREDSRNHMSRESGWRGREGVSEEGLNSSGKTCVKVTHTQSMIVSIEESKGHLTFTPLIQ